jgi:hypothetical protein
LTKQYKTKDMSTKISEMTAATDLTGAVVPVVQGGVNKKADASLFSDLSSGGTITASSDLYIDVITNADEIVISSNNIALYSWDYADSQIFPGSDMSINSNGAGLSHYIDGQGAENILAITDTFTISSTGSNGVEIQTGAALSPFLRFKIDSDGNITLPTLPTSSSGLTAGMLWNDNGTVKIVLP